MKLKTLAATALTIVAVTGVSAIAIAPANAATPTQGSTVSTSTPGVITNLHAKVTGGDAQHIYVHVTGTYTRNDEVSDMFGVELVNKGEVTGRGQGCGLPGGPFDYTMPFLKRDADSVRVSNWQGHVSVTVPLER